MTEQLNDNNTPEERTDTPPGPISHSLDRVMVPFLVYPFFFSLETG